jgi:hypothetical protein
MHPPTLGQIPSPLPGKTGWPWMEESPQLPETMPDGSPWPSNLCMMMRDCAKGLYNEDWSERQDGPETTLSEACFQYLTSLSVSGGAGVVDTFHGAVKQKLE